MGSTPSITTDEHDRYRLGRRGKTRLRTRPTTRSAPPQFDRLPREIFSNVQVFLLGVDLFSLSHVNRHLYELLAHAELWAKRLENYDFNPVLYRQYLEETAKMRYALGRSLKLPGVSADTKRVGSQDRGASVTLPRIVRHFHLDPISFDLWFCLLPPPTSDHGHGHHRVLTGGVLFGSQSDPIYARGLPGQHEHIIHVDTDRNLYCSLMWQKPVVASKLAFNRWYHVALSYDGDEQRVYVSGKLMHVDTTQQMTFWSDLPFAQLGSGLLNLQSPGKPTPDFHGWYGFNGLIDDFRIWNLALTAEQIHALARGQFVKSAPAYRLKKMMGTATTGRVSNVRCSRPVERVVEMYPVVKRKKKLHRWLRKVKQSGTESASCISIQA